MRYNLKLIYSPIKWLGCLIFVILIPIAMYVPTYFDFVNVSTIYLPFVGIVLFTDITLLDKGNHIEEITYLSDKKPIRTFSQRYFITIVLLFVYIILANIIFRIIQQFRGDAIVEPISTLQYVLISGCGCLFIGTISMTVSTILNNIYVGYGFSIIYWLYWNINCQTEMIINPFPFIANPTFYEKPLSIIYIFTIILIILNCILSNKSPFYLSDKVKKLIVG